MGHGAFRHANDEERRRCEFGSTPVPNRLVQTGKMGRLQIAVLAEKERM